MPSGMPQSAWSTSSLNINASSDKMEPSTLNLRPTDRLASSSGSGLLKNDTSHQYSYSLGQNHQAAMLYHTMNNFQNNTCYALIILWQIRRPIRHHNREVFQLMDEVDILTSVLIKLLF